MLAVVCVLHAQPRMQIDPQELQLGDVLWKQPTAAMFRITNTGNDSLMVHRIHAACGCIVVQPAHHVIAPGEYVEVGVEYDARQLGKFFKSVGIYSNATPKPVWVRISGCVKTEVEQPIVVQEEQPPQEVEVIQPPRKKKLMDKIKSRFKKKRKRYSDGPSGEQ